jgi:hypothetical protein
MVKRDRPVPEPHAAMVVCEVCDKYISSWYMGNWNSVRYSKICHADCSVRVHRLCKMRRDGSGPCKGCRLMYTFASVGY